MKAIIAAVVGVVILLALLVWGLGSYLGPDDLASCDVTPNGTGNCQKADAIVAISGGDTTARTNEAIALFQHGWANQLIFSGAALDPESPSNAEAMREQAIAAGVPSSRITIEEFAYNTEQNALRTSQLIADRELNRIILVTSGYHQRRASIEFKQVFDNREVVNHPVAQDKQWSPQWWTTPTGWWLAGGELVKILLTTSKERIQP